MRSHVPRPVPDLRYGSTIYVALEPATELVIFVHGFNGDAEKTWRGFHDNFDTAPWSTCDILFVGYGSTKENVLSVTNRLRDVLPGFYPNLPTCFRTAYGKELRPQSQYSGLRIVGHSLGGLIVRRLMVEIIRSWLHATDSDNAESENLDLEHLRLSRPTLLDARIKLFSPASEGFLPKGWLGTADAALLLRLSELRLKHAPAYRELQIGSQLITNTKEETLLRIRQLGALASALRATNLWANPDNVVQVEDYKTDRPSSSADAQSHSSVCKPNAEYLLPFSHVER